MAADSAYDKNIFFSPFSIYTAASFLYEGARDETASQMIHVFGFEPDDRTRHDLMSNTSSSINRIDPHVTLVTANALWLDEQFDPYQEYVDIVRNTYHADIDRLDFAYDAENSATRINDWASDKTRGKITNVVTKEGLEDDIIAVLNNAVYFKGDWAVQFDPALTHKDSFWITSNDSVTADFMRLMGNFDYGIFEDTQILRIPYEGDRLSMLVFLPLKLDGIHDLERVVSAQNMDMWRQNMAPREVIIWLPKFETETNYSLNYYLSNLGMPLAFDRNVANFSGMADLTKVVENIFVNKASQKAYVNVNEKGTEAAAVTTFGVAVTTSLEPTEPPKFIVDHPFVFTIQDDKSGAILFMGRMSDPTI